MQLIKTYKAVINHQLGYTLMGQKSMMEHANLRRLKKFIFPMLDKLEIGKEIPEDLKDLAIGNCIINLSYTFSNEIYTLVLIIENDKLKCASKNHFHQDQSEENADGYYDFMTDFK